jgi:hypothetical protein
MKIFNGLKGVDLALLKQTHHELVKEWQEI